MTMPFVSGIEGRKGDLADQAMFSQACNEAVSISKVLEREPREMLTPQIRGERGEVYCKDCGNQIPQKRLDAKPYATRCKDCQEKVERKQS